MIHQSSNMFEILICKKCCRDWKLLNAWHKKWKEQYWRGITPGKECALCENKSGKLKNISLYSHHPLYNHFKISSGELIHACEL